VIRAVIDTNVLVSALLSPEGNAALIVQAVKAGLISIFLTDEIASEYAEVLKRPKFRFEPDVTSGLLDMIHRNASIVQPDQSAAASPDPGDTKFLQCALAARADAIITGNQRDYPDGPYGPTQIFSISEFLERLTDEKR
jgi:putative PIN family toxin of toxin-antitoxin system